MMQPALWDMPTIPTRNRKRPPFKPPPLPFRKRSLPPFAPNSDTSKAAAERAERFHIPQGERLWRFLASCGECGATDAEAEVSIPMRRQSICARRNELMKAGRVKDTGIRRGGCAVWIAVEVDS